MYTKYILFLSLGFLSLGHVVYASDALNEWNMTQLSEGKLFRTSLNCKTPPVVAGFQNCQLKVFLLEDQASNSKQENRDKLSNTLLKDAKVDMKGGMPAHHHGLPTSPVVNWSESDNAYIIKGLKYSMPGEWFLSFYIEGAQKTPINIKAGKILKDKVSFKFSI